jgi:hypothetical protein
MELFILDISNVINSSFRHPSWQESTYFDRHIYLIKLLRLMISYALARSGIFRTTEYHWLTSKTFTYILLGTHPSPCLFTRPRHLLPLKLCPVTQFFSGMLVQSQKYKIISEIQETNNLRCRQPYWTAQSSDIHKEVVIAECQNMRKGMDCMILVCKARYLTLIAHRQFVYLKCNGLH